MAVNTGTCGSSDCDMLSIALANRNVLMELCGLTISCQKPKYYLFLVIQSIPFKTDSMTIHTALQVHKI